MGTVFLVVGWLAGGCGGADSVLPFGGDAPLSGDASAPRDGAPGDGARGDGARSDGAQIEDSAVSDSAPTDAAVSEATMPDDATVDATPGDATTRDAVAADGATRDGSRVDAAGHDGSTVDGSRPDATGPDGSVDASPSDAAADHVNPTDSGPDSSDAGRTCVPDPVAKTCASTACGTTTGNCGQTVVCPDTCSAPSTCGGGGAGPNDCGCSGGAGQACCSGHTCASGYACANGVTCEACGASSQPCCASGAACAAGLACDQGTCDTCFVPLPFASSCTSIPITREAASNTSAGSGARFAADGDRCTSWNSGGLGPQSWAGAYACPAGVCPNITKVGVLTSMLPGGNVTLEIRSSVLGLGLVNVYGPMTIPMQDNSYYEFDVNVTGGPSPFGTIGGTIEVDVLDGPSWVAFREIVLLSCN